MTMQRKKDYAEYRDAKNEMRELLTVRANVERILNDPMEQRDDAAQKKQERYRHFTQTRFFEIASFRRKTRSRRTKECEKQGFGGNATNKQMHKRVPMCPACAQVVRLARTTTR